MTEALSSIQVIREKSERKKTVCLLKCIRLPGAGAATFGANTSGRALRDVGVWRRSPRGHDLTQRQPGDMNSSSLTIKQAPNNIVCVYSCGLRRINLVGDGRACAPLTLRAPISLSARASPSSNEFRWARKRLALRELPCVSTFAAGGGQPVPQSEAFLRVRR
jgi:hypothetical protein